MSVDPADDPALDPTAQRVADFVSAEVGPPASTNSSEKAFVRRLARHRRTQRTRRRLTVGVAVASALVVVGLAGSRFRERAPETAVLSYRVDNQDPPSGGYILAPQTAESLLAFSDGSKVKMAARGRGRVVDVSSRGARFALDAGQGLGRHRSASPRAVDLRSRSVPGERSRDVVHHRVEPRRRRVRSASFQRRDLGREPGRRTGDPDARRTDAHGQPARSVEHPRTLQTMTGREVPSPAESAPASNSFEPHPTAPSGPAEPPRWSHRGWMGALSQNRAADILADADRRGPTSVIERADSEDLWALANAARYAGRHALAGQALSAHRRRFPSSARSREAAFLLGRLHDGDPDPAEALGWYDRYLVEAHDGVGVADALGRKMTLLERSNRRAEALAVAREYLRGLPRGTYANAARALVRSSMTGQ